MARERTPEGKRVVIPVRVSEPKAEAIDKARGETPRSVWVEGAIDAELGRLDQDGGDLAPLSIGGIEIGVTVDKRQPPGVVGIVSRGRESTSVAAFSLGANEPEPEQDRKPASKGPCEHRIWPGSYCTRCGRLI